MPNIKQPQGPKQKYGLGMGYAKKALDLIIQINKVEEFVSHLKNFIEESKDNLFSIQNMLNTYLLEIRYKYKSSGEPSKKVQHKALANEDGEEMRHENQNRTETSSNNQVSALEKK
ncbi:3448_t:CDS:2, partial [Gigaspora margarita]